MLPLTAVLIVRDEADRVEAALRSVSFADAVVVLDSGSEDDTVERCLALGAQVLETDWPGYVAQKNRAIDAAGTDWVLCIDADEQISAELAAEIAEFRRGPAPEARGFRVPRLTTWQGAPIRHGCWWPDARVRLFDRRFGRWSGEDPHDRVVIDGPIEELTAPILHDPYRDLTEHLVTIARYAELSAGEALARGRRARRLDLLVRPLAHLAKALLLRSGWRDGPRGVAIAFLGAASVALKWALIALRAPR
jgi:glycosyltransferase involved in cell wall biosynthesis